MAKARRKSTSIDGKTVGELSEAELNQMLQRAIDEDLRKHPERWAAARAEAAALAKASKALDRMMAIEAGLIAPPWVDKLIGQLKARAPTKPSGPTRAGVWVKAEAGRMKAGGEIREGIRKTEFAQQLHGRLKDAAITDAFLRVVGWRHIKNSLPDWGLWPISSIK